MSYPRSLAGRTFGSCWFRPSAIWLIAAIWIGATGQGSLPAADPAAARQQAAAVYERVRPAVVRLRSAEKGSNLLDMGAIVTPEGHVLLTSGVTNARLEFTLADGRRVPGQLLGSMGQWGAALARLEGDGPWPHVPLAAKTPVRAGQPLVTLVFPLNEAAAGQNPLVDLEWVDRSAPGFWFARPDGTRYEWQMRGTLAFDLEGRLLGIESMTMLHHGTLFTHIERVRTAWDDLAAGKAVDRLLIAGKDLADATARPAEAPVTEKRGPPVSDNAVEQAVAASVRIRYRPGTPAGVSGTIISPEGLVATCAHHFAMPGAKVTVELADGRDVAGEIAGVSFPADIGLVRITERGPYPHVELGDSLRAQPGEACILVGYGPVDRAERRPAVRQSRLVPPRDGRWTYLLSSDSQARLVGGDSGGGLFDAAGKLLAFSPAGLGYPDWPKEHVRVELLRVQREALASPVEFDAPSALAEVERRLLQLAADARPWVVEILSGEEPAALGTIVSERGTVLTKASALPDQFRCRLADGRVVPAKLRRVIREHDLAILDVDADRLSAVQWSMDRSPAAGTMLSLAGPQPVRGTVAHRELLIPGERGRVGAVLRDTERGLEVAELASDDLLPTGPAFGFRSQVLKAGDIVRSVEGQPLLNLAQLRSLLAVEGAAEHPPVAVAGDVVQVVVARGGTERTLTLQLRPPDDFPLAGQTPRRSEFARVLGVQAAVPLYGGPVIDSAGKAIGMAIAARQRGWVLVLPAEVVQQALAE